MLTTWLRSAGLLDAIEHVAREAGPWHCGSREGLCECVGK